MSEKRKFINLTGLTPDEVMDTDFKDIELKDPGKMSKKELIEEVRMLRRSILRW